MQTLPNRVLVSAVRAFGLPLEPRDPECTADAIVVLGAPLRPDGRLSLAGRERVTEGVRCFNAGVAPILAFTGGAAHSAAEAPEMARIAAEMGVPKAAIVIEDQSATTSENARFSATLLRERNVKTVWIVSQPFHLRRGRRLFRKQGFIAHARPRPDSVQYERPDLAWKWIAREYVAWAAHFALKRY